jgi:PRA1 family protein 1
VSIVKYKIGVLLLKNIFVNRLTSPIILIALAGVFYACFKLKQLNQTFTVMGRQLDTNQQCILVNVASVPVLYLAGAGS